MLSAGLPVGLCAWNVTGHTSSVANRVPVVVTSDATSVHVVVTGVPEAAVIGVIILLSLPLTVSLGAWNVAQQATTAGVVSGVPVPVVPGAAVIALVAAAIARVTASVAALLMAGLPVGVSAWQVTLGVLSGGASVVRAIASARANA